MARTPYHQIGVWTSPPPSETLVKLESYVVPVEPAFTFVVATALPIDEQDFVV